MGDPFAQTPTVTGVSPTIGTSLGGDSVVITGTRFSGAAGVTFGAVAADDFTINSDSSITTTSPPQAAGTVDVRVDNSPITPAGQFTYKAPPEITAITPNTGKGGDSIVITGSNFTEVNSVTFGDVAANYTIDNDSQITADAPHHPNGDVVVTVSTPDGNTTGDFTYVGVVSQNLTGVTIKSGDALSSALDCTLQHPLVIFMPTEGWDAAVLSFSISMDDVHYFDLYDNNKELFVNVTPNTATVVDPRWFVVGCYVKFRAGFSREPLPRSDDRTFMVVMADR